MQLGPTTTIESYVPHAPIQAWLIWRTCTNLSLVDVMHRHKLKPGQFGVNAPVQAWSMQHECTNASLVDLADMHQSSLVEWQTCTKLSVVNLVHRDQFTPGQCGVPVQF
jgi:hypothetical protein